MIYYDWPQLIEVLNQILMSNFFHSCNCNIVLPLTACLLFYLWEYKYTHFKKSFRPWETKAFITRKTQHSEFVKMASASTKCWRPTETLSLLFTVFLCNWLQWVLLLAYGIVFATCDLLLRHIDSLAVAHRLCSCGSGSAAPWHVGS